MIDAKTKAIENAIEADDFAKARRLLRESLRASPEHHWLLTRLALTYYEEQKYKKALEYSQKAILSNPTCPLVLWDYAGALDMLGRTDDAIQAWSNLVSRGVEAIAFDECCEGLVWACSLVNDCRYRIGLAYQDKGDTLCAVRWIEDHIEHRRPGVPSIYHLSKVRNELHDLAVKLELHDDDKASIAS